MTYRIYYKYIYIYNIMDQVHIHGTSVYIHGTYTLVYAFSRLVCRVGDGTIPLAIVLYIDGSFVQHKIPVRPFTSLFAISIRSFLARLAPGGFWA